LAQHVAWAKQAGINTFAMDTWIPDAEAWWMDRNTPPAVDAFDQGGISYFFLADGWFTLTGSDAGGYDAHAIAAQVNSRLSPYFARPGYLRVDGRPVVFFWASDGTSCGLWQKVRAGIEGTIGPVYMTGFSASDSSCWDRVLYYNPYSGANATYAGQIAGQNQLWKAFQNTGRPWAPTATPGYNDTKVRSGNPPVPLDANYFRDSLRTALSYDQHAADRWLFVCSFNEWYEGSGIEPAANFADPTAFLRVMREEVLGADALCDPVTQPAPNFGGKDGACRPSCGMAGGSQCASGTTCPPGLAPVGPSYDCELCCG
jgi:hypothetical protein